MSFRPHGSASLSASYNPFIPPQRDNPFPVYAQARQEAPVFHSPVLGMWIVTRYRDIAAIVRDPVRFSSGGTLDALQGMPPEVQTVLQGGYGLAPTVLATDPPQHTRLRRILNVAFTPQRIAELEPNTRALAHSLVDAFANTGQADLIKQFAYPFPMTVIADIMGIPRERIADVKGWCDAWAALVWQPMPLEQQVACAHAIVVMQHYFAELIAERRAQPQHDVLSAMLHVAPGEEPLQLPEIMSNLGGLMVAGHETTMGLIGNALLFLLQQPERWQALAADPHLAERVVEETVRYDGSIQGMVRTATEDVEIDGVQIPAGARIQIMFAAANRDDEQFTAADHFDMHRDPSVQHLGFGRGIHYCLGAPLARMEGRVALEVLVERLPRLRLPADFKPEYAPSLGFRSLASLPLEWESVAGTSAAAENGSNAAL